MGKITPPSILTVVLVILIIIGGVHYRNGKYKIRPHPDTTARKNPMTTIGVVYDGDTLYLSGLPKPHDSGYKIVIISSRKMTKMEKFCLDSLGKFDMKYPIFFHDPTITQFHK